MDPREVAAEGAKAALAEQARRNQAVTVLDGTAINGLVPCSILIDGDTDPIQQVPVLVAALNPGDRCKVFFTPGGGCFAMLIVPISTA